MKTQFCFAIFLFLYFVDTAAFVTSQQQVIHRPELHLPSFKNRGLEHIRILLCPGFGQGSNEFIEEGNLKTSLMMQGWDDAQIRVLPIKRSDWLQVFIRGITDIEFWKGTASPIRPAFRWYLDKVSTEINSIVQEDKDANIILIACSAGGWLARAALGFLSGEVPGIEQTIDLNNIIGCVTLGTPNIPPPQSVWDLTRGALRITDEMFPGSYFSPKIKYMTVMSCTTKGEGLSYDSYTRVCGIGNEQGDGIVPCCAGHLEDAIQINLDNVSHEEYGTEAVVPLWHDVMMQNIVLPKNLN